MWLRLKPRRIHARRTRKPEVGSTSSLRVLCLLAADRDGREKAQGVPRDRYIDRNTSSLGTCLARATARRMALSVPIRRGE